MHQRVRAGLVFAALAFAWLAVVTGPAGADEEAPPWDHSFNGHEMWKTSLEEGLKAAGESNRQMLIDIYSRG